MLDEVQETKVEMLGEALAPKTRTEAMGPEREDVRVDKGGDGDDDEDAVVTSNGGQWAAYEGVGSQTILGHDRVVSPHEDQKKLRSHTGVDTNAGRDGDDSGEERDTGDGAGVGDAGKNAKEEGGDDAAMPMNDDDGWMLPRKRLETMLWQRGMTTTAVSGTGRRGREGEEEQAARASGDVEGGRQSQGRRKEEHPRKKGRGGDASKEGVG